MLENAIGGVTHGTGTGPRPTLSPAPPTTSASPPRPPVDPVRLPRRGVRGRVRIGGRRIRKRGHRRDAPRNAGRDRAHDDPYRREHRGPRDRPRSDGRARPSAPARVRAPRSSTERAYENRPLPIGHGQTISQPYIVALMTHLLRLEIRPSSPRDRHRVRVSGRRARRARRAGPHHRDRNAARPGGDGAASPARLRTTSRSASATGTSAGPKPLPFEAIIVTRRRHSRAAAPRRAARAERGAGHPGRRAVLGADAAPRSHARGRRGGGPPDSPGAVRTPDRRALASASRRHPCRRAGFPPEGAPRRLRSRPELRPQSGTTMNGEERGPGFLVLCRGGAAVRRRSRLRSPADAPPRDRPVAPLRVHGDQRRPPRLRGERRRS